MTSVVDIPAGSFQNVDKALVWAWDQAVGLIVPVRATDNALHVYQSASLAGERAEDSTTGADHLSVVSEWKALTVPNGAGAGVDYTIVNAPCLVRAIRVRKTDDAGVATANTAGIILIKNGTAVVEGAAAAATPGTVLYDGLDGAIFGTSLVMNFASAADDVKIEVLYRPLPATVTWAN